MFSRQKNIGIIHLTSSQLFPAKHFLHTNDVNDRRVNLISWQVKKIFSQLEIL